ncbi:ectoine/hydroxyectoine ABC transporter substrate-binding protein EhuB [Arenibaculum pallidiluteum]|uniref:ectoine/hydroxyectoine ABC transporter substrate-binding protein EhuB n=1 Tax=Arenibaculum pallidiluteum TaxID=2812559 RepID=UPI001A965AD2|nr:ectoine/hydroxyectoine ABC transporter substrate-binding protein EhuB [Arenibaculum pallidiluteum]
MKKFFSLLLAVLAVIPVAVPAAAESALDRVRRTGEVRLGYAIEPPFAFRTPAGRLTGAGPEVARRVFAAMGVERVQAVEAEFGSLIRDLRIGRVDVIAAGMAIVPERCREVIFSEPFFLAGTGFAVRPGNPRRLHGFRAVAADPTVRLGVVAGAQEIEQARASGVAESQLVIFPDAATAAAGVRAGRVDAYAATAITVQDLVQRNPRQIERAQPFDEPATPGRAYGDHGAYAFRPGDAELRDAFNRHLADLLRSPDYLELTAPFGFTASQIPRRTMAELCAGSPALVR